MVEEIWQELAKAKYMEWENAYLTRTWELQSLKYVFPVSFTYDVVNGYPFMSSFCMFVTYFWIKLLFVSEKLVRLLLKKNMYWRLLKWKAS
jgi:hypothetical protein